MREFFKSRKFKVILAFLAFLVGIMIYAVTKGGYSISSVSFVNTVSKPFRYTSNRISMKVESTLERVSKADAIYDENQELKKQISDLSKQLAEYDAMKSEVEELRKFIGIKEKHEDYNLSEPCEVLSFTANDPFKSFTVDKGSEDGIEPYCPVVTADGLVGMVTEVSAHVSTVRTILSPDLSVAVQCSSSGADKGIIEGNIAVATDGNTMLTHVRTKNHLHEGDLMITTGSSGLFPKNLSIGTVKTIDTDSNGLSIECEIEPCVDITGLTSVIVITNFAGKRGTENED